MFRQKLYSSKRDLHLSDPLNHPENPLCEKFLQSAELETLDKATFVKSYVSSQLPNKKTYAAEGRSVSRSWSQEQPSNSKVPPPGGGFGTPILRPRVKSKIAILHDPANDDDDEDDDDEKSIVEIVRKAKETQTKKAEKGGRNRADSPSNRSKPTREPVRTSKKRRQPESSPDSERYARLAERRERKRAKREIIKPPRKRDSEEENEPVNGSKKTKLPTGLALMYGFTATNVGKSRLTAKPPANPGVFIKGKASAKVKERARVSKKNGVLSAFFSESKFLSKTTKGATKPKAKLEEEETSSSSDFSESAHTEKITPTRKPRPTNRTSKKENNVKETQLPKKIRPEAEAESAIWDIEDDDVSELPSTVASNCKEGTIVLNTRQTTWANLTTKEKEATEELSTKPVTGGANLCEQVAASSAIQPASDKTCSSVGPSQSASQAGAHERFVRVQREAFSKYFARPPKDRSVIAEPAVMEPTIAGPTIAEPAVVASMGAKPITASETLKGLLSPKPQIPGPVFAEDNPTGGSLKPLRPGMGPEALGLRPGSGVSGVSLWSLKDSLCALPGNDELDLEPHALRSSRSPCGIANSQVILEVLPKPAGNVYDPGTLGDGYDLVEENFYGLEPHCVVTEDSIAQYPEQYIVDYPGDTTDIDIDLHQKIPLDTEETYYEDDQMAYLSDPVLEIQPFVQYYNPLDGSIDEPVQFDTAAEIQASSSEVGSYSTNHGRSTLFGLGFQELPEFPIQPLSIAEADVARNMRGHWRPQRF